APPPVTRSENSKRPSPNHSENIDQHSLGSLTMPPTQNSHPSPPMAALSQTETLKVGDRAPDFALFAANREGSVSLKQLLERGPLILDFLRGTWRPNCVK